MYIDEFGQKRSAAIHLLHHLNNLIATSLHFIPFKTLRGCTDRRNQDLFSDFIGNKFSSRVPFAICDSFCVTLYF